jgi:hypothetical protein
MVYIEETQNILCTLNWFFNKDCFLYSISVTKNKKHKFEILTSINTSKVEGGNKNIDIKFSTHDAFLE